MSKSFWQHRFHVHHVPKLLQPDNMKLTTSSLSESQRRRRALKRLRYRRNKRVRWTSNRPSEGTSAVLQLKDEAVNSSEMDFTMISSFSPPGFPCSEIDFITYFLLLLLLLSELTHTRTHTYLQM
ncbi:uncharacterized protein LOC105428784 [Pogonomyrmex barbatus]|uniref:Uncharacterized protein LOC105428784 n=1 Tax=Pogonomyrmex barbatus TaxID=144034 RepID=A0A6I9WJL3_9HYME|nr:uncharacterized protein LOC105428784 [Pogonomyrmex barbatus]